MSVFIECVIEELTQDEIEHIKSNFTSRIRQNQIRPEENEDVPLNDLRQL